MRKFFEYLFFSLTIACFVLVVIALISYFTELTHLKSTMRCGLDYIGLYSKRRFLYSILFPLAIVTAFISFLIARKKWLKITSITFSFTTTALYIIFFMTQL